MDPIDVDEVDPIPYDAGEDYDAGDDGPVVIPAGTDAILYAELLEDLAAAGFPEEGSVWDCHIVGPHPCEHFDGQVVTHFEVGG